MFYGWSKFKGWKVLEFFLEKNEKIHVNGLAKRLGISPGTAQRYLTEYEKQGLLEKEKTANSITYKMKESPLSLELKKTFFLSKIAPFIQEILQENPFISKLALYGSHAKGNYDEKSDIDLLAISHQKKIELKAMKKIEAKTGKEIKIQVFTITEWKKLLGKKDSFALAIIKSNVLLSGEPL